MDLQEAILPDDVAELKRMLLSQTETIQQLNERVSHHEQNENYLRAANKILDEKVKNLISQLYDRKTEKLSRFEKNQSLMFDEIEQIVSLGPELQLDSEEIEVPGHKRKKRKSRLLPDDLPRQERVIDISDEEKICACGALKTRIGEEVSEKADFIPAKAFVVKTIRPKYACNSCHGEDDDGPVVSIAPVPPSITGKSILAEGLFGHIIVSKFVDALPFYRQETILRRAGVEISRKTMASLAKNVFLALEPLKILIESMLPKAELLGIDESRLQVMNEPGRSNTQLSYMWHIRALTEDGPIPYFIYRPTRSAKFLEEMLHGFQGVVVTDGYSSYNIFDSWNGVIHTGCNSHARRKFTDTEKVSPGIPEVAQVLLLYKKVYRIETELRDGNAGEDLILERRQNKSKVFMEELHALLVSLYGKVNPEGKLGNAVSYALKEWSKLIKFLDDPKIPIDNNFVENGIRPFVVGRKNWLFSNTPEGADASAFYYTLVEWAKAKKLDPYLYMSHLFRKAPLAVTENDWIALLPSNIEPEFLDSG